MLTHSSMALQRLSINDNNPIGVLEKDNEPLKDGVTFDNCLSILSRSLKKDICDISRPDTLVEEVGRDRIETAVPQDLQYACHHWVDHLQKEIGDDSLDKTERFLKKHVLHWFEAMSLLGLTSPCVLMIKQLQSTVSVSLFASASAFFFFLFPPSNVRRLITLIAKHCQRFFMIVGASSSETVPLSRLHRCKHTRPWYSARKTVFSGLLRHW